MKMISYLALGALLALSIGCVETTCSCNCKPAMAGAFKVAGTGCGREGEAQEEALADCLAVCIAQGGEQIVGTPECTSERVRTCEDPEVAVIVPVPDQFASAK